MGQLKGKAAVLVALGVLSVSVGGLLGRMPDPVPVAQPTMEVATPQSVETVSVHVSGMVVAPGVVDVPADAIVADAIGAAGGMLPGALVDQINLAAPVTAGDQIVVPGPDGAEGVVGVASGDGLVSLNRATPSEFETLPGVGPVLAERMVAFREENGGFESVDDLLEVPGIGESKLAAIRDLVRP